MTTVVCVKAGDKYGPEYVNRLRRAVALHGLERLPFACLTDDPAGVDPPARCLALPPCIEGWWNKLYVFAWDRHGVEDDLLYLDLDTVVVGDLGPFAERRSDPTFVDGLFPGAGARVGRRYGPGSVDSSAMFIPRGWGAGIWRQFRRRSDYWMHQDPERRHGDQWFISRYLDKQPEKFQGLWPSSVVSYRWTCVSAGGPPPEARLVSFHGRPSPHEVDDEWVRRAWHDLE